MTRQPWTIRRDAELASARDMMREHSIRHLPVLEAGKLVGIVSERDVFLLERYFHLDDTLKVEDAMTPEVYAVHIDAPVDGVVETMSRNKYGSAVVVGHDAAVAGIFTTVDGMQAFADVLRLATA